MLKSVLVIGSGPIVIGQAAEFDYSGSQACRVLKEEGIRVVLVNNNPATIMTDPTLADVVYSEPLTKEYLKAIIDKERPDALLAGMGGQTALNLSLELYQSGILDEFNVKMIGTNVDSIEKSEDRELFKNLMLEIGQPCLESHVAESISEAKNYAETIGYPIVVRPAFTLGGTGGGFCYNENDLNEIVSNGLAASRTSQVLIEKSIKGWKEIEYEMIRDYKGNTIVVCNMENFDPVGIHTGDSIVVAPSQTLTDLEYQMLRRASIDIVTALNIVGGCNVQLALNPNSLEYIVIEVNPRVSRSSALASKATGYPIAKVATKIALGYALDEITNDVTKKTKACFEPVLDYCALKIPKWPFNKFKDAKRHLGTQMMATGEVMSIANNFESALMKGIRSLEINRDGLYLEDVRKYSLQELLAMIVEATDERIFYLAELIRREVSIAYINKLTSIDLFFLKKIEHIVKLEEMYRKRKLEYIEGDTLLESKKIGFSDQHIANLLLNGSRSEVRKRRMDENILPAYKMVDTCAGEFEAFSPYYYSTYDPFTEVTPSDKEKVIIIGSGPIAIGQGVEFDYCSVHGVYAVQEAGYEAILINNNPETVSTDFDISDKLYFEPITFEDVMNIIDIEKPLGVILQYGGQTAIKLAKDLHEHGVRILGTSFENIHKAEDRHEFNQFIEGNKLIQPKGKVVYTVEEAKIATQVLEYPILCRPSYVIGGEGMKIVHNEEMLLAFIKDKDMKAGILMDEYIEGIELEVDCISDGNNVIIPGIMEHLEGSGVHSGDSTSIYPPQSFSEEQLEDLKAISVKVCKGMHAIGLVNIQYIFARNKFYIIEVNPRASRTVPFLSKITGVPMIKLATEAMLNKEITFKVPEHVDYVALKVPVFSMEKIPGVDVVLSPEMKSTGEMLCVGQDLNHAIHKAQIGQGFKQQINSIFISINESNKHKLNAYVDLLGEVEVYATEGTGRYLKEIGVKVNVIDKLNDSSSIIEKIKNKAFDMVINMPSVGFDSKRDGYRIRRTALNHRVQSFNSLDAAFAYIGALKTENDFKLYDICQLD